MIHVYIKAFLLKMDRAKGQTVRPQITNVNPLLQYYRFFQLLLQPYAEHEGIITKLLKFTIYLTTDLDIRL